MSETVALSVENGVVSFQSPQADATGFVLFVGGRSFPCAPANTSGLWRVTLPDDALSSGMNILSVLDANGAPIASLPISVGAINADVTAQVAMLRAELDLVKATLRRQMRAAGPSADKSRDV